MTKLAQIIEAATSDTTSTASLLRMVRVVASRLDTVALETWVERELSGYTEVSELPPYRGPFSAPVMGHFAGPFGSEVTVPIPRAAVPKRLRDTLLFKLAFTQSVSAMEGLRRGDGDLLRNPWDPDAVVMFNRLVEKGEASGIEMHGLVQAWRVVSPQQIDDVLDQVRNRVLTLALDLEKIAPQAGEAESEKPDVATVTNVVNNNIYGHGNNVAVNSSKVTQTSNVQAGDLDSLLAAVRSLGLPEDDVAALKEAIETDAATQGPGEPGPAITGILGRLALGANSITGKIGIGAAGGAIGGTLSAIIKAYFGLN